MNKNLFNLGIGRLKNFPLLLFYLSAFCSFACPHLLRQQTQSLVTGTVAEANGVLPGVTVLIKGTTTGTQTDANGKFSLLVNPQDVLVFSYMGFKTVELAVNNQTTLNVLMVEDTTQLKEVVLNAGYYSVKEKEATGSISRITSSNIETQPVSNVLATMQGRMAGVNIVQETGVPGGGYTIRVRGINSLRTTGNEPLYIIDGVPYASDPIGYSQTSSLLFPNATNPLNSISPEAIENIEVLKDADATAIYGSRGANGVVLITTKKGKVGKTQYSFSASTGAGKATDFPEMMNTQQYLAMRMKAYENDGITTIPANAYDVNGTWDENRYTDWQKELLGGTAQISTFQGTIAAGSEQTQFLLGGNYFSQGTVFPGSFIYKKGGVHLNLSHTSIDQKFRLNLSSNYNIQDNDQPAIDITSDARRLAPNAPAVYDENGNLNWENNTFANPLAPLNGEYKSRTSDLVTNAVLSYQLAPKLIAKASLGYTTTNHEETRTTPSTIYNPALNINSESSTLFVTNTDRRSWVAEPQLNYTTPLAKGVLDVLAGATFQQSNSFMLSQMGTGFTSNGLIYNLASAASNDIFIDDALVYKYQAFFGRVNYNWNKKYIVNLTGRRDGSSRFGPGNQFATFGAIGAAWIFSEESFLKDNKLLTFGKLRSSFGTTGNDQIGDYQYLNTYSSSSTQYQNVVGLQPTRLFNPDFGWETNQKWEAALELGFWQDRIFVTAAYFQNKSSNQLVGIPIPATTGFTTMQANLEATVENKGYELTIRSTNISNADFKWTTDFNWSILKNELLEFPNIEASAFSQRYRVGQPLNINLVYQSTGVNPQTGLFTFEDLNGDGQITFPDDRQIVVDLNPQYFGGIQNKLSYKNWTLDFLFQFVKQKNKNISNGAPGRRNFNQPVRFVDSWQQEGDVANYQMYTSGTNSSVMNAQTLYINSDALIVDASFIRLKNVSLSFDVPLPQKNTKCKLFIEGQNLLTLTKYEDGDPEFNAAGFLPPLRIINTGVQFQF